MIFDSITNFYLYSVFTAWIISCIVKAIIDSNKSGKFSFFTGFRNGGMPSSHAALMGSITFALFLDQRLSPVFFLAVVLSALILRDAVTVRHEVGLIGERINNMLRKNNEAELKVVYGHTVKQVGIGLVIGIASASMFYFLLF